MKLLHVLAVYIQPPANVLDLGPLSWNDLLVTRECLLLRIIVVEPTKAAARLTVKT